MKVVLRWIAGQALQIRRSAAALAMAAFSFGCAPAHQPDSIRTVAAVEIALKGPRPVRPSERHAALVVNLAGTMATFVVETYAAKQGAKAAAP